MRLFRNGCRLLVEGLIGLNGVAFKNLPNETYGSQIGPHKRSKYRLMQTNHRLQEGAVVSLLVSSGYTFRAFEIRTRLSHEED